MFKVLFALVGAIASAAAHADGPPDFFGNSCERNPALAETAQAGLAGVRQTLTALGGLFADATLEVGDVNGTACGRLWVYDVLQGGSISQGNPPECGIILKTDAEKLRALASASVVLFRSGADTRVSAWLTDADGSNWRRVSIAFCAAAR